MRKQAEGLTMKTRVLIAAGLLAFTGAAHQANAQAAADLDALRGEQAEIFQEMFAAPDNVDLMLKYALISIRLQDYEAAITTLERILIYRPDEPRVKVELGASYFRIGSYPVAKFYFQDVANDPNADEGMKARVAEFIEEIDRRTQKNYVTGKVGLATVFTTNANNGASGTDFLVLDQVFQVVDPTVTDQTDVGVSLNAQLSIFNDLGGADGDQWRTDIAFLSTQFIDVTEGDIDALVLRTGPRLSTDDDRYGVKVRPYFEVDHVRYGNDPLLSTIGIGAEVTNTIDQTMSFFSDFRLGYRDHHQAALPPAAFPSSFDGLNFRAKAGLNYFHSDDLLLTGIVLGDYEGARTDRFVNDASDSVEIGVKGIARFFYDSGFEEASRRWMLTGEAQANIRNFSSPSLGNSNSRDDVEFRVGVTNTAYFHDGWALVTKANYFLRDSNYPQFDLDNFTMSIGAEYRF